MLWRGQIGISKTVETKPGIFKKSIQEYPSRGTLESYSVNHNFSQNGTNTDVTTGNMIKVKAVKMLKENWAYISYATMNGVKLRVTTSQIKGNDLYLHLGGLYSANGK